MMALLPYVSLISEESDIAISKSIHIFPEFLFFGLAIL